MSNPTLSVLLPNYNHADFLPRCLDAILGQSFRDFELIIVDDASTDDSVRVIEEYARRDPRIRFYRNPQNRGVVPTLNRALELARGEFAHGAASDDFVLPGYFQGAVELLRKYPQAGLALGLTECVGDDGRLKYVVPGAWSGHPTYLSPDELCIRVGECGVPGPAIWRREWFLQTGGYRPELEWHCDWFALQVLALRRGVCFFPRTTTVVRVTDGAYSVAGQRNPKLQRPVLQRMLALIGSEEYADIRPYFYRSPLLRHFGPELVCAAAQFPNPSPAILECIRDVTFGFGLDLLRHPDPETRASVATLIGRYGRTALSFYRPMRGTLADPDAAVRAAATATRKAIWRAAPVRVMLAELKRDVSAVIRRAERFFRPLHHESLQRIEAELHAVSFLNQQIHNALSTINTNLEKLLVATATPPEASADRPARKAA